MITFDIEYTFLKLTVIFMQENIATFYYVFGKWKPENERFTNNLIYLLYCSQSFLCH